MLSASFSIRHDHPCLADHFPGYPIAPGVLTLDYVSRGLLEQLTGWRVTGFPQVKFLRPVLPMHRVNVTYTQKVEGLFQFKCECDGEILLTGQIRLTQEEAALV